MAQRPRPLTPIESQFEALEQQVRDREAAITDSLAQRYHAHVQALDAWLTGTLNSAGIQLPDRFDLQGMFSIVVQVLGLTYDNLRARAVGMFGEPLVAALETGLDVVVCLTQEGLPGVWQWLQEPLGTLKDELFTGIQELLLREVIEAVHG